MQLAGKEGAVIEIKVPSLCSFSTIILKRGFILILVNYLPVLINNLRFLW